MSDTPIGESTNVSINITPEDVKSSTDQIVAEAENINNKMVNVYDSINDMNQKDVWHGANYDRLIEPFITMKEQLESFFQVLLVSLPTQMQEILSEYAKKFEVAALTVNTATLKPLTSLSNSDHNTLIMDTAKVEAVQEDVTVAFNSTKLSMETINTISSNVNWNSTTASGTWKNQVNELISPVIESIDKITSEWNQIMSEEVSGTITTEETVTVK